METGYEIAGHDVVAQARTWLGTAFHHQGRLKKTKKSQGGCDCIGLVLGVARELKIASPQEEYNHMPLHHYDQNNYSMVPQEGRLQSVLDRYLMPVNIGQEQVGDVVLFKIDTMPQHVGIVSDYSYHIREGAGLSSLRGIIHCYMAAGKVVEHRFDELWKKRMVAAYRLF